MLILIALRPELIPPWSNHPLVTSFTLNRLGRKQCVTLVEQVTRGKVLPGEVLDQIVAKPDGVPLFVEELTKSVLESGLLVEEDGRYGVNGPLPQLAIPASLHDSLMARLDRLAPVKEIAQIGAAIGREPGSTGNRLLAESRDPGPPALGFGRSGRTPYAWNRNVVCTA